MASLRQFAHVFVWTKRHLLGQYRVDEVSHLKRFVAATDVCFDVGAHAGSWTIPLSKLVEKGHVYAFEALPYYANVLTMTLKLLGRRNVSVINKAVTEGSCAVHVVWKDAIGNRLTGKTHIAGPNEHSGESVVVQGISLDSFCEGILPQRIRFVKCDVEGVELLVLRGAVRIIETWRPIFYCELWSEYCQRYGYSPENVFEFFERRGYKSYIISPSTGLLPLDVLSYQGRGDVLFVPSETAV